MLTQTELLRILHYNPKDGLFSWKISPAANVRVGASAGTLVKGHIGIRIAGVRYAAHKLAWLYMTGVWPTKNIDHKNVIGYDNTWTNLRVASQAQNMRNVPLQVNNTSGRKGVYWHKLRSKWVAQAKFEGKTIYLGIFNLLEDASKAYQDFAKTRYGEFYHVSL